MARKLRPQTFDKVAAQNHIVDTLRNAIVQDRVAHAYLFSGPRGTGKTTMARLLAKALNCIEGPTPDPCGKCKFCESIANGTSQDVREIDGASTGLVDDVRQLREEVGYAASKGKRKVYIIDEVHMLSPQAFNALLKTLEEPPPHVIFVFATTEPHKVLETVTSRCQRYNFRRIPAQAIVEELKKALDKEGITAEETALFQIARKAEGGMRDALSLLDQVIAFSESGITDEAVQDLLGLISRDMYFDLTQAIVDRDGARALGVVDRLIREGSDLGEFVDGLMAHFRYLLVARVVGELDDENLPETDRVHYTEVSSQFEEADLVRMLNAIGELETQIGRVAEPRFWLELTVMKLVQMTSSVNLQVLLGRLEQLERGLKSGGGIPPSSVAKPPLPRPNVQKPARPVQENRAPELSSPPPQPPVAPPQGNGSREPAPPAENPPVVQEPISSDPPSLSVVETGWAQLVQAVKKKKISVGTFLAEGRPHSIDDRLLVVAFQKNREFHANQVRRSRALVEEVAAEVFRGPVTISCEVIYDDGNGGGEAEEERPEEDERVQMVLQVFSGEVIR
jgi:DNA polymerase-3 subunit gamma/tau